MTIEFVGMVFPSQWSETQGVRGSFDFDYLRSHLRAHEYAGFDRVLIASGPGSADSLQLAAWAATQTERLGLMIAHRPGIWSPTAAARAFATLDHASNGRIRLHAITGIGAEPQEGDHLADKAERYARADEYLQIVRKLWTSAEPFDFDGRYYSIREAFSPVKPLQKPLIPISFGGASPQAYDVGVRNADLYAIWGEPLADAREHIGLIHEAARKAGVKSPRVSLSVRLILGRPSSRPGTGHMAFSSRFVSTRCSNQAGPATVVRARWHPTGCWRLRPGAIGTTGRCGCRPPVR